MLRQKITQRPWQGGGGEGKLMDDRQADNSICSEESKKLGLILTEQNYHYCRHESIGLV